MTNTRLRGAWCVAVLALCATACQNDDLFDVDQSGVVVTVVDSGAALASARTFVLPDTVIELPVESQLLSHSFDKALVASVRGHLTALGWQDLGSSPTAKPDVVVLIATSTRIESGVAYFDWFGAWGYLPYWGPAVGSTWAWGVPAGSIAYAFQVGTVLISMLDLRNQNPATQRIPLLWTAGLDGVVTDPLDTGERALVGVDQAFAQSPYLRIR